MLQKKKKRSLPKSKKVRGINGALEESTCIIGKYDEKRK